MPLPYILFAGTDSRNMGVVVNEYPPRIKPKARVTEIVIPGRSGSLTIAPPNVYDSIVLPVQCTALPAADIEAVSAWLRGYGALVLGDSPTRYYAARIDAQIAFDKILRGHAHRGFTVPFVCQPGRFIYPEPADITLSTNPQTLVSAATMDSLPLITITGTGTVSLTIGAYSFTLTGLNPAIPVVVDCEAMTVTNAAYTVSYINNMTGSFPKLVTGNNVISRTGTVTSIVIKTRYRWL